MIWHRGCVSVGTLDNRCLGIIDMLNKTPLFQQTFKSPDEASSIRDTDIMHASTGEPQV